MCRQSSPHISGTPRPDTGRFLTRLIIKSLHKSIIRRNFGTENRGTVVSCLGLLAYVILKQLYEPMDDSLCLFQLCDHVLQCSLSLCNLEFFIDVFETEADDIA